MHFSKIFFCFFLLCSCGKKVTTKSSKSFTGDSASVPNGLSLPSSWASYSSAITVSANGKNCLSGNSYTNEICGAVTVCVPNTNTCDTISGLLIDTGSAGLRVFKSVLTKTANSLPSFEVSSNPVAECVTYGDGSTQWGPIVSADIKIGGKTASNLHMQILNPNFGSIPSSCNTSSMDTSPSSSRFNGILGIAPWINDCGSDCASYSDSNWYFSCSNNSCQSIAMDTSDQLQNPIRYLDSGLDGYMISFPKVELNGASSLEGYLFLGSNAATHLNVSTNPFSTDSSSGTFYMTASSNSYSTLMDSGTNVYLLSSSMDSSLTECSGSYSGYFCPVSTLLLTLGFDFSFTAQINVTNLNQLSNNLVLPDIAAAGSDSFLILGLPFFYGRNIVFVLDGEYSSAYNQTGPLIAF
jgi:hypothetical protein